MYSDGYKFSKWFFVEQCVAALLIVVLTGGVLVFPSSVRAEDGGVPVVETPVQENNSTPPAPVLEDGGNGADGSDGAPAETTTPDAGEDGDATEGGEAGTDGTQAGEQATPEGDGTQASDGAPSIIETGDASTGATVVDQTNVNDTTVSDTGTSTETSEGGTNDEGAQGASGGDVAVENESAADNQNDAVAFAETGGNMAEDADGAYVFTGEADAFAVLISLFNVVITNSTGSLLFLQNPIGDMLDLSDRIQSIFSGVANDETCSLAGCVNPDAIFNIVTDSVAEITNTLVVRSHSGGNQAQSEEGAAVIETGDASAFGSIINFGNLQIVNSRYLVILMSNVGDLIGDVVLPPPTFFASLSTVASVDDGSSFAANNTADVTNNGTTTASSGENAALGSEGALVVTGDANTGAVVQNFLNQNSVGGRPICFIVNVGGTWNGDVIGLPENFSREETPFGEVICGAGNAERATDVEDNVTATTTNYAKILNNVLVEAVSGGNVAEGTIAAIRTGDANAFLHILNFANQNIIGQDWIFALFTISGDWNGNLRFGDQAFWDDVNEQLQLQNGGFSGTAVRYTPESDLQITKNVVGKGTVPGGEVKYQIVVTNAGKGPAYHAELFDTMLDGAGQPVFQKTWRLGEIPAGERITVDYTVQFATSTKPGKYTNKAQVKAITRHPSVNPFYGAFGHSPTVSTSIIIVPRLNNTPVVTEEIVAAPQCAPYLTSYLGINEINDEREVRKLQFFLRDWLGSDLQITGIFDNATLAAVQQFQETNKSDILEPWGITRATGYVYYTTQNMINNLYCQGVSDFGLTAGQQSEIETFRTRLEAAIQNNEPLPPTSSVGAIETPTLAAVLDMPSQDEVLDEVREKAHANVQAAAAAEAIPFQLPPSILNLFFRDLRSFLEAPMSFNFREVSMR